MPPSFSLEDVLSERCWDTELFSYRYMAEAIMVSSMVCRYEHFNQAWYVEWADIMGFEARGQDLSRPDRIISRKAWEWFAIAQALRERNMLREGRCGLGFAVGTEPLPSAFAARGVNVLGTDLGRDEAGWATHSEHANRVESLFHPKLISHEQFAKNVQFQAADMRALDDFTSDKFDFVWSSCSFEHLGSLSAGIDFLIESMRLVKPGGVGIHTTEYNVSSNSDTIDVGGDVIYRRCDIEELDYMLRRRSCALEAVDYDAGSHQFDIEYDFPPYFTHGRKHVKLSLMGYISTSILLVIRKGAVPVL